MSHNFYLGSRKKDSLLVRVLAKEPLTSEPKTLYKKALLGWDASSHEITIHPLVFPQKISFNAQAECRNSLHYSNIFTKFEVPSKVCSCGFYAYLKEEDARDHIQAGAESFILKVIASGKLLEYNKGYRYGHQRVEEVLVYSCFCCDKPADRVILEESRIRPTCKRHAKIVRPIHRASFTEMGELASRSLPAHAPRIKFRSANEGLTPWVSEMDIKRLSEKPNKFGGVMYDIFTSPLGVAVALMTTTPIVGIISILV